MSAKKSKKLKMPTSIVEAMDKLIMSPLEAYACAAKAYKAVNADFRHQRYFTLAFAYQGARELLKYPEKRKTVLAKAAPGKNSKAIGPQEILRLSVERAEGATTKSARKIAHKHARALSVLWKEKKSPDTIVEELRKRKIEKLARQAAGKGSDGSEGSTSGRSGSSGTDEVQFDVCVRTNDLTKALKGRSRVKVVFYVERTPAGEYEFSELKVIRLKKA
jgi:hypothetical protein